MLAVEAFSERFFQDQARGVDMDILKQLLDEEQELRFASFDGLMRLKFVFSAIESSKANGKWTKC